MASPIASDALLLPLLAAPEPSLAPPLSASTAVSGSGTGGSHVALAPPLPVDPSRAPLPDEIDLAGPTNALEEQVRARRRTRARIAWVAVTLLVAVTGTALAATMWTPATPAEPAAVLQRAPIQRDALMSFELAPPPAPASPPIIEKSKKRQKGAPTVAAPAVEIAREKQPRGDAPPRISETPAAMAEPAAGPHASAPPAEPRAIVDGGGEAFDKGAANRTLSRAASGASACHQPGDPFGVVRVAITFAPSGKVTSSVITSGPLRGTSVGGCVARLFREARVPPFEGAPVVVEKTVAVR